MGRKLKTEEWRINDTRVTASFMKLDNGDVLYTVTGHFNKGRNPKFIDLGKARSKTIALASIKSELKRGI